MKNVTMQVVYKCRFWLSSLKQSSHFINSLTRLTLLKITPSYINGSRLFASVCVCSCQRFRLLPSCHVKGSDWFASSNASNASTGSRLQTLQLIQTLQTLQTLQLVRVFKRFKCFNWFASSNASNASTGSRLQTLQTLQLVRVFKRFKRFN